jgi:hypothetical protein
MRPPRSSLDLLTPRTLGMPEPQIVRIKVDANLLHRVLYCYSSHSHLTGVTFRDCPRSDIGCKWRGPATEAEAHIKLCPYEVFKDFVTETREELAALRQEVKNQLREIRQLKRTIRGCMLLYQYAYY